MTAEHLVQAARLQALREAWRDYECAQLGRLNVTAEALRAAAKACGWTWADRPLPAWVKARLGIEP